MRGKTTEACGELLNLSELKLLATKQLEHTQPIFREPRSNSHAIYSTLIGCILYDHPISMEY